MRFLRALSVAILLAVGLIVPNEAQAIPIVQTQLVVYGNSNYNTEIGRQTIALVSGGGNCVPTGYTHGIYWYLPTTYMRTNASSVLLWVPSGYTTCNSLWVQSLNGDWWGKCISYGRNGLWDGIDYFGPGYENNLMTVWVGNDVNCPPW